MVQTKLDKALKAYAKPLLWAFGSMVVAATAYTLTRGSGQPDQKGSGDDDWVYSYSASKEFQKSVKPSKSSDLKKKSNEEEEQDLDFENWDEEKLRKWLEEVSIFLYSF